MASSVTTGMTGSDVAKDRPCAIPHAVRRPVKDPGPHPKAMASQPATVRLFFSSSFCNMGSAVSEWFENPSLEADWTVSPHIRATEAMSDEVSMAIIVDIPVLYREGAGWRIFRFRTDRPVVCESEVFCRYRDGKHDRKRGFSRFAGHRKMAG